MTLCYNGLRSLSDVFSDASLGTYGAWEFMKTHSVFRMGKGRVGVRFYYKSKVVRFSGDCPSIIRRVGRQVILEENKKPQAKPMLFQNSDPDAYTPEEKSAYKKKLSEETKYYKRKVIDGKLTDKYIRVR